MSRLKSIVALTAVVSGAAGFLLSDRVALRNLPAGLEPQSAVELPTAAKRLWFPPLSEYSNDGEPLEDGKFEALFAVLKKRVAAEETSADFEREASIYFHSFLRRISVPSLEQQQIDRIMSYLAELEEQHPDHSFTIRRQASKVQRAALPNSGVLPFSMAIFWFPTIDTLQADTEHFSDATIEELIGILDLRLSMPETALDIEKEAGLHIRAFAHALQQRRSSEKQIARVGSYLSEIETRYPALGELIDRSRFRIEKLTPGQVAPNITGKDLDGVDFELRDYRGNIVVLYFTGQWCGPCKSEYPYQRFMQEIFEDHPVTLLAVNSDDDRDYARDARKDLNLHFRAWWDGYGEHHAMGPIATAWDVKEWPTIYILNADGVIRFVQKRHLEAIRAAQELLDGMPVGETQAPRSET